MSERERERERESERERKIRSDGSDKSRGGRMLDVRKRSVRVLIDWSNCMETRQ